MPNDRDSEARSRNRDSSKMSHDRDTYDSENNPFVAFRRFADEQVSSLLQSITGLPSAVSRPQSDRWMIFNEDQGYNSMAYRQRSDQINAGERGYTTGPGADNSSSGDRNVAPSDSEKHSERSAQYHQPEQEDRWPSSSRRNHRYGHSDFFGFESLFDRFDDHFLPFSSPFFHPRLHSTVFDMFEDTSSPAWPITYILFSPYSPLHLERQAYYRAHNDRGVFTSLMSSFRPDSERDPTEPQWREAFEDLLRLENGKPMLDPQALTALKTETEKDWLQGLVKRGSLGDHWKYLSGTDNHGWSGITFDQSSEDRHALPEKKPTETMENREEAETELDIHERFLSDLEEARKLRMLQDFATSPSRILDLLHYEAQRRQDGWNQSRGIAGADDEQSSEDTETWVDLVSGGNRKSVPETQVDSTSTEPVKLAEESPPRVISTMSHTERRRLADGSVQTKVVKTKRFADGREETDESVEVTHPQSGDRKSSDSPKSGGGWFWKD